MKVYALREVVTDYGYMPVIGFHTSLEGAKKQAKELFDRSAEWDVALYEIKDRLSHQEWIDLLNGDAISSAIDGKVPRDFIEFEKVAFESAAMKRYRKEKTQ